MVMRHSRVSPELGSQIDARLLGATKLIPSLSLGDPCRNLFPDQTAWPASKYLETTPMPSTEEYEEARAGWDSRTVQEKEDFLDEVVNDTLEKYGYDEVEVGTGSITNDRFYAQYEDDTVTFDQDYLEGSDFDNATQLAFHEAAHALDDQASEYDPYDQYNYSDNPGPYEDFAKDFAEAEMENQFPVDYGEGFDPQSEEWAKDNRDLLSADNEERGLVDDLEEGLEDLWEWAFGSGS
jgi:hypothetical protein